MYIFLTDYLAQTLDSNQAAELHNILGQEDVFDLIVEKDLQHVFNTPHHLPCLSHVIQLAVNAFLHELKIDAKNDDIVNIQWNEEDKYIKEKGLLRTLEKVSIKQLYLVMYLSF